LISRAINTQSKQNFYGFVSRYCVVDFQQRLALPDAPKRLLDLALACSFNSKATFNHVFKKQTGMTPPEYCKQLR